MTANSGTLACYSRNILLVQKYLDQINGRPRYSIKEISEEFNISPGRVSQLVNETCRKINPQAWVLIEQSERHNLRRREMMIARRSEFLAKNFSLQSAKDIKEAALAPLQPTLAHLNISPKISNLLVRSDYKNLQQVLEASAKELLSIEYLGETGLAQLERELRNLGFEPRWSANDAGPASKKTEKNIACSVCGSFYVVGRNIRIGRIGKRKIVVADIECTEHDCGHKEQARVLEDKRRN